MNKNLILIVAVSLITLAVVGYLCLHIMQDVVLGQLIMIAFLTIFLVGGVIYLINKAGENIEKEVLENDKIKRR